MDWKAQKRACDQAARSDADEGENRREDWRARGLAERYDLAYRERREQVEATQEREDALEPLRAISRAANAVYTTSHNSDIAGIAGLIERLADHLIAEKESN